LAVKNILKVENLAFVRNDLVQFEPISFVLSLGESLHLEGANGSGKTTFFQLLIGMLQPSAGKLYFRDQLFKDCRFEYLSDILFIGHQAGVKSALSVEENLRWMSPDNTTPKQITLALKAVELAHYANIPCHNLSAGQHRRVALARLMTSNASLWYLDEPFAALDKQGVDFIESCMQNHLEKGGSIVFSSHQDLAKMAARRYKLTPFQEQS